MEAQRQEDRQGLKVIFVRFAILSDMQGNSEMIVEPVRAGCTASVELLTELLEHCGTPIWAVQNWRLRLQFGTSALCRYIDPGLEILASRKLIAFALNSSWPPVFDARRILVTIPLPQVCRILCV